MPLKDPENLSISSKDPIMKNHASLTLPKLMFCFIILTSLPCAFYSLKLLFYSNSSNQEPLIQSIVRQSDPQKALPQPGSSPNPETLEKTSLKHIVFGIGTSSNTWKHRKEYIKYWWRPNEMRGHVWMDQPIIKNNANDHDDAHLLPPIKISSDTSKFMDRNQKGTRDAIRISRIVSETLRMGMEDVRWFVMGDDDTVFITDNLVRVLSKYDHNQFYYIGSTSESHVQNMDFSYGMAYGGGGFAISYPLAKALSKMQDKCLHRYPNLYSSDQRIHACLSELGVPLSREPGFHQCDLYENIFGLLAAHPITPLVSLHHLDIVGPIFPNMDRVESLKRLKVSSNLDSAGLIQQSFCYDISRNWTVSVSWGYAIQILRGNIPAREMEIPVRTFFDWNGVGGENSFSFNTRPVSMDPCQKPSLYFVSNSLYNPKTNQTASEYVRFRVPNKKCRWKTADPARISRVEVYKKPDPTMWDRAPRRNCCRILPTKKKRTLVIDVGVCRDGETV
ncbi:hypothetical protein LWI29_036513 [Acer saccharum]|uniref:Uncharacterized protein n=1 Tax=Acer saccharum TaxID=4024 RepID=A0AA39S3B3_ACESA|nr:hypothetical protein LWI29_036513 [Acer saccharum]